MAYVTADRSLPRSLDVQVSLARSTSETRTDLSTLCVCCETLGFLPDSNRVRFYSSIDAVALDFAAGTEAYFAASAFFAQDPKPAQMAIGEVFLSEQPAMLVSPELTAAEIAAILLVSDGSMDITSNDGSADSTAELTALDFTSATDLDGIAEVINAAFGSDGDLVCEVKTLPGAEERLVIKTVATGDDVTISYPVAGDSGTFVGTLLGLTLAGDGTSLDGYTPTGIADELQSIANAAMAAGENIYGWALGNTLRITATQTAAAAWVAARVGIMALVTDDAAALSSVDSTDIASVIGATTNKRVVCIYHTNSQQYPDVSILAYMLSVNYQIKDNTVTAKFKQLPGVSTEQLTETQWAILQGKGFNTYTTVGNSAYTYRDGNTSFTGWFLDTVINLDNFIEDLTVAVYNVFMRNRKVPYTRAGQELLADACRDVGAQYVYNGTFADREKASSTRKAGIVIVPAVQVIPTPISQMSAADRSARIAPPISMIVQESGAMHEIAVSVDVVS